MKRNLHQYLCLIAIVFAASTSSAQTVCLNDSTYAYNNQNVLVRKHYYTYDNHGWQTEWLMKDSINGVWVNSNRILYSYNSSGKETEYLQQQWQVNSWENTERRLQTYNTNNDVLTQQYYYWDDGSSAWIQNGYQQSYTYNANNKKILHLQAYISQGAVQDSTKTTFVYDLNWNEITSTREGWTLTNPVWTNIQKFENAYTAGNQLDSSINFIWNPTTLVYDPSYLSYYLYDAQNNLIEYLVQQNNGLSWVNSSKQTYSFDVNNNNTSYSYYTWDSFGQAWSQQNSTSHSYNSNNQPLNSVSQSFNFSLGSLVNSYQGIYTYDANDNPEFYISETWDLNTNSWLPASKSRYFYNCGPLNVSESSQSILRCYPNPAANSLTISVVQPTQISIFNVNGKELLNTSIDKYQTVDISGFAAGVYFIHTKEGQTVKVIKE